LKLVFCKSLVRVAILFSITVAASNARAEAALPRSVLLIDQENQSRVWNFQMSNALRSILTADPGPAITVYADNLDLARIPGPAYEKSIRAFLIEKCRNIPVGVIVVNGARALDLVLSLRPELWPDVPVVFAAVNDDAAARMKSVPNVTGHIMRLTLRDMVSTARLVVPNLKQIVLVGDPLEKNTFFRGFLAEIPDLKKSNLELVDLTGLAMTELKQRTATLPSQSAIAYTTLTVDGAGVDFLPRDVVVAIAKVANRPIVTDTANFVGFGATGGLVVSSPPIGEQAGRLALRILNGESASDIPVVVGNFAKPVYDWRELKRWNVSEESLPPGSEILFREPTAWERYSWQIALITAVILAQAGLISALLREHRRRQLAEVQSRARLTELARVVRFSTAGELTASIAHEINQPLGAILTNAEIAEAILKSPTPDVAELKEIVKDILRDDRRANEVIHRMRSLLTKAPFELKNLDLNDLVRETVELLTALAVARKVELIRSITSDARPVLGDRIQLQQVILNLVSNGIDAMKDTPAEKRIITIRTSRDEKFAELSVSDRGSGIPEDKLKEVFEPFFTSKAGGMGMGLSIARTIIEAHHGLISAKDRNHGGASFRIRLPFVQ
jgi:signal transduction histidine kinase